MNPKLLIYLYSLFTLVVFLISKTNGQILDFDGNPLKPDVGYYILPIAPAGKGNGLTLASRGHNLCPVDIVLVNNISSVASNGLLVKFSVWMSTEGDVTEADFVTIETVVGATMIHLGPTMWMVDDQRFVTTGPKPSEFGPEALNSLFKIEGVEADLGRSYKFVSCLKDCDTCSLSCGDIGTFEDEFGVQRLALSNGTLLVRFKKAE